LLVKSSFSSAKNPIGVCLTRVLQFYSQFQWILKFFPSKSSSFTNSSSFMEPSSFPLQNHHISIYFNTCPYISHGKTLRLRSHGSSQVLQVPPTSSAKASVAAEGEDHTRSLARPGTLGPSAMIFMGQRWYCTFLENLGGSPKAVKEPVKCGEKNPTKPW
jgi:hypothetical protein